MLQDRILRDSGICGMDSNFDNVLDGLRGTISNLNVSDFTSKDTVPLKAQHVLMNALFSKSIQDMEVKFDMITRQKAVFGSLQATQCLEFSFSYLDCTTRKRKIREENQCRKK